ncbi:MAG: helix-turn-helix domain-containing protein, partial [Thiolinea sp.]
MSNKTVPSTLAAAPFIQVINDLRESKNWSQSELAIESGLSNAQLSRLLAGKSKRVRQATVDKFAAVFGLTSEALAALIDDASANKAKQQGAAHTIRIDRLPTVSGHFVGRTHELALLDKALSDEDTNIVQLVASGGAGKTKLLRQWLNQQADNLQNYIVWSFYSQGAAEDKQISATPFFNEALRACGAAKHTFSSEEEKGDYLAELLIERDCLLVLDGLEPLQHAGHGA